MYTIDLHNHTPLVRSDYRGAHDTTFDEIADAVVAAGIDVFGVTDHFSTANLEAMATALDRAAEAAGRPILVVGGAELRVTWRGDEVHMVPVFSRECAADRCFEVFAALGLDAELDDVTQLSLVTVEADPAHVIDLVHAVDGLAIAGHVDRVWGSYRLAGSLLFAHIVSAGIDAAEVIEPSSAEILGEHHKGLTFVRASDSHSLDEVGRRTCALEMEEFTFEGLKHAIREGSCL